MRISDLSLRGQAPLEDPSVHRGELLTETLRQGGAAGPGPADATTPPMATGSEPLDAEAAFSSLVKELGLSGTPADEAVVRAAFVLREPIQRETMALAARILSGYLRASGPQSEVTPAQGLATASLQVPLAAADEGNIATSPQSVYWAEAGQSYQRLSPVDPDGIRGEELLAAAQKAVMLARIIRTATSNAVSPRVIRSASAAIAPRSDTAGFPALTGTTIGADGDESGRIGVTLPDVGRPVASTQAGGAEAGATDPRPSAKVGALSRLLTKLADLSVAGREDIVTSSHIRLSPSLSIRPGLGLSAGPGLSLSPDPSQSPGQGQSSGQSRELMPGTATGQRRLPAQSLVQVLAIEEPTQSRAPATSTAAGPLRPPQDPELGEGRGLGIRPGVAGRSAPPSFTVNAGPDSELTKTGGFSGRAAQHDPQKNASDQSAQPAPEPPAASHPDQPVARRGVPGQLARPAPRPDVSGDPAHSRLQPEMPARPGPLLSTSARLDRSAPLPGMPGDPAQAYQFEHLDAARATGSAAADIRTGASDQPTYARPAIEQAAPHLQSLMPHAGSAAPTGQTTFSIPIGPPDQAVSAALTRPGAQSIATQSSPAAQAGAAPARPTGQHPSAAPTDPVAQAISAAPPNPDAQRSFAAPANPNVQRPYAAPVNPGAQADAADLEGVAVPETLASPIFPPEEQPDVEALTKAPAGVGSQARGESTTEASVAVANTRTAETPTLAARAGDADTAGGSGQAAQGFHQTEEKRLQQPAPSPVQRSVLQPVEQSTQRQMEQSVQRPIDHPVQQLLSNLGQGQNLYYAEIPIPVHGGTRAAAIVITREQSSEDDPDSTRVRIHLSMGTENMGTVVVDILGLQDGISCHLTADETGLARLNAHIGELSDRMREVGVRLSRLECHQAVNRLGCQENPDEQANAIKGVDLKA